MPERQLNRYPGIQPFSRQYQECFFGRNADCEALLSLILLERITVLFGKSGYGKSSLLHAGIAPALEREGQRGKRAYIPVFIRFQSRKGNEDYNWFDWFVFYLDGQVPASEATSPDLPRTIWGELKRRQTESNQSFVLIFDQFEELFTYPAEQIEAFKNQLADLLYADIPEYVDINEDLLSAEDIAWMSRKLDVRAVIAIRSDRLSELDQLKNTLPGILNKRYELGVLTLEQAREALVKPAGLERAAFVSPPFDWQPESIDRILDALNPAGQIRQPGVEPFQLQVLAQYVENKVIEGAVPDRDADGRPDVGLADLPNFDRLYEGFYQDALNKVSPATRRLKARRLIEKGLIFEGDNQRINLHERMIRRNYGVDDALIQELTDLRLLRAEPSTLGGNNIELSHDAFVQPILNAARRRREKCWRNLFTGAMAASLFLLFLITLWLFSPSSIREDSPVYQKNVELNQRLDSLNAIRLHEAQARNVVLTYVDCVNRHDINCLSDIMRDTLERYFRAENLARVQREKLERDYFRRHGGEKIEQVQELTVTQVGNTYEATLNSTFLYEKKGRTPVIFQIKLDSSFKIFHMRSFIVNE